MGDLKTNWTDPGVPIPGMEGAGVTARGGDPLIDTGGDGALKPLWDNPVTSAPGGKETPNSVSGLPLMPARNQPTEAPPSPPTLQDRNPGTINEK